MPVILLTIDVRAPIERCFDLARSIDFHMHSMAATGERAIAGLTRGLIGEGHEVTWRARHLGMTRELSSRVTYYERPRLFVDEQVRGAFARFRHEHRFEPLASGGTRITERFDFTSPLGPLGRLADTLFLARYMRRLIERHALNLKAALESEQWRDFIE